jgi:hypothetical protein
VAAGLTIASNPFAVGIGLGVNEACFNIDQPIVALKAMTNNRSGVQQSSGDRGGEGHRELPLGIGVSSS